MFNNRNKENRPDLANMDTRPVSEQLTAITDLLEQSYGPGHELPSEVKARIEQFSADIGKPPELQGKGKSPGTSQNLIEAVKAAEKWLN